MKHKKYISFAAIIIIFFIYIFAGFRPLKTELQLTPEWTIELTDQIQTDVTYSNALPFKLGQNIGYFTHDGRISLLKNFDYKATISPDYFATYPQNANGFDIFNKNGELTGTVEDGGYPYIAGGTIFLLLPGGAGFEAKTPDGKTLMRYQHTSPVTALNSNSAMTVAGFADGTLCTFDKNMKLQNTLAPGGSDLEVILGANTSANGNYFACVSGHDRQRFELYKTENHHAKIVFHTYLDRSIFRQTFIYFNSGESYVYYNDADGLGIVNCENFKYTHIDIPGTVLNIQESPVSNSLYVLSKSKSGTHSIYTVTILEEYTKKTGNFSFEASSSFILTDENSLFIGKDSKISKLIISKE